MTKTRRKFTSQQAWYVITQPIHPSQKVTKRKDHFLIDVTVVPTYELVMLIMSWGTAVEVIKPKALREKILNLHRECLMKKG